MGINECISFYKARKFDESLDCFEGLLKKKPESHELNYCMGVVLFEKGDFSKAADFFKKANAIIEDSLSIYYTGLCYFNLLEFNTAEYFFKQAIVKEPMNAEPYFMMALCSVYHQDTESFSSYLKKAILLDKQKTKELAIKFITVLKTTKEGGKLVPAVNKLLSQALN